jgi:hypothetical protein
MREKIVASWSSGKDGAMALEYVLEGGFEGVATFGFSQSLRKAFCRAVLSRREKGRSLQSGLEKCFRSELESVGVTFSYRRPVSLDLRLVALALSYAAPQRVWR